VMDGSASLGDGVSSARVDGPAMMINSATVIGDSKAGATTSAAGAG
jgi:hypothetical protein